MGTVLIERELSGFGLSISLSLTLTLREHFLCHRSSLPSFVSLCALLLCFLRRSHEHGRGVDVISADADAVNGCYAVRESIVCLNVSRFVLCFEAVSFRSIREERFLLLRVLLQPQNVLFCMFFFGGGKKKKKKKKKK